jgi:hypothetical protein
VSREKIGWCCNLGANFELVYACRETGMRRSARLVSSGLLRRFAEASRCTAVAAGSTVRDPSEGSVATSGWRAASWGIAAVAGIGLLQQEGITPFVSLESSQTEAQLTRYVGQSEILLFKSFTSSSESSCSFVQCKFEKPNFEVLEHESVEMYTSAHRQTINSLAV